MLTKKRTFRTTALALATAATFLATATTASAAPLPPQGSNPDQWHCRSAGYYDDSICLHLNQFLGWWTGFNAEYFRGTGGPSLTTLWLHWDGPNGQHGDFPNDLSRPGYGLFPGDTVPVDSGASLPSYTCIAVSGTAFDGWRYYGVTPLTVCRNN